MNNSNPYEFFQNLFHGLDLQENKMKGLILADIEHLPESKKGLMLQLYQEGATIGELMSGMQVAALLQEGATFVEFIKAIHVSRYTSGRAAAEYIKRIHRDRFTSGCALTGFKSIFKRLINFNNKWICFICRKIKKR